MANERASIADHFSIIPDPRVNRRRRHLLHDILVIAICAVVCGADDWVSIAQFGRDKQRWLRGFLRLPNGIPSHDTFGRVFAALNPTAFAQCFTTWVRDIANVTEGEVVAIDGKTVRRSFDKASSKAAIHMVSAWAATNKLVLGQVKTDEKSNEITAIPKLLALLELRGCIITIDAMGCQKEIAAKIIDREADYVLGLKGNQGNLHADVASYFEEALKHNFADVPYDFCEQIEHGHGRDELRRTWCTSDLVWFTKRDEWKGLKSIAMIEEERTIGGIKSVDRRYFISSLPGNNAREYARAIREHWGVENSLHWVLDVAFREDECRVRTGNAAENLAMLRHVALNLLKNESTAKVGVKNKRLKAGWNENYLLKILGI
jgi:predicted transposase YbfD/YdcC